MKKTIAAVALALALTGCGAANNATGDTGDYQPDGNGVVVEMPGSDPVVTTVTVDGTKCVIAKASGSAPSISCDWNTP
jgi:outer membrane lipoprotein SlyB